MVLDAHKQNMSKSSVQIKDKIASVLQMFA
jgi:uncharacterized protein YdcH (DUF465 family)